MSLESVFANPPNLVGLANKESGEEAKERSSNTPEPSLLYYYPVTKYFTTFMRIFLSKLSRLKGKIESIRYCQKVCINYDNENQAKAKDVVRSHCAYKGTERQRVSSNSVELLHVLLYSLVVVACTRVHLFSQYI